MIVLSTLRYGESRVRVGHKENGDCGQLQLGSKDDRRRQVPRLHHVYLCIRMIIILKLNTFIRDSSPIQKGTPLSRHSSHTTQSDHWQTTAMGSRLHCDALFVPQHHTNPHLCVASPKEPAENEL
jgi:hypothetical protein